MSELRHVIQQREDDAAALRDLLHTQLEPTFDVDALVRDAEAALAFVGATAERVGYAVDVRVPAVDDEHAAHIAFNWLKQDSDDRLILSLHGELPWRASSWAAPAPHLEDRRSWTT